MPYALAHANETMRRDFQRGLARVFFGTSLHGLNRLYETYLGSPFLRMERTLPCLYGYSVPLATFSHPSPSSLGADTSIERERDGADDRSVPSRPRQTALREI